jgi:hypothetical protein
VVYEWASGVRVFAFTRQMAGQNMFNETDDIILGTKGQARILRNEITGENPWRYPREKKREDKGMYDIEHDELFASIKAGKPINNGVYMSYSTMLAILGRMATYTGQRITWDEAINSKLDLTPKSYAMGPVELPAELQAVAMPGITKLT